MNHPPIPPNNPWFYMRGSLCFFRHPQLAIGRPFRLDGGGRPAQYLQAMFAEARPIIAAVARCAWLDEAERIFLIRDYFWSESRRIHISFIEQNGIITSMNICQGCINDALENADDWAKWGKSCAA